MPWYAYSSLTAEDADAVAFYLKNNLPAVRNQIPAAALNEGFTVMATEEQALSQPEAGNVILIILIVIAGVGIILLVSLVAYYTRQRAS